MFYKNGIVSFKSSSKSSTGEKEKQIIDAYNLHQNYPNPFNPSTRISYKIPSKTVMLNSFQHLNNSETQEQVRDDNPSGLMSVRLNVFDVIGREIATLVNEKQRAGDLNGDGYSDFAITYIETIPNSGIGRLYDHVYYGNSKFELEADIKANNFKNYIGDINNDGFSDFLYTKSINNGYTCIDTLYLVYGCFAAKINTN